MKNDSEENISNSETLWRGRSLLIEDNVEVIDDLTRCLSSGSSGDELLSRIEKLLYSYALNTKTFIISENLPEDKFIEIKEIFIETLVMIAYHEHPSSLFAPGIIKWLDDQVSELIMFKQQNQKSYKDESNALTTPATHLIMKVRRLRKSTPLNPFKIKNILESDIKSVQLHKGTIYEENFDPITNSIQLPENQIAKIVTSDVLEEATTKDLLEKMRKIHRQYKSLLIIGEKVLMGTGDLQIVNEEGKVISFPEGGEGCALHLLRQALFQMYHTSMLTVEFDCNLTDYWKRTIGSGTTSPERASRAGPQIKDTFQGALKEIVSVENTRRKSGDQPAMFRIKSTLPIIFTVSPKEQLIREMLGGNYRDI